MRLSTANRILLFLACAVVTTPALLAPAVGLRLSSGGAPIDLLSQIRNALSVGNVAWMLVVGVCLVLTAFAWARRSFGAMSFVIIGLTAATGFGAVAAKSVGPSMIKFDIEPGTEMWCNDTYIGRAPLEMSVDEFRSKVKPWDTPPIQERVIVNHDRPLDWQMPKAQWSLVPGDPTQHIFARHWPHVGDGPAAVMSVMQNERYWWRFEKDGYQAISHGFYFSPESLNHLLTGFRKPGFPAARRHQEVLRTLIRDTQYKPDDAFRKHIQTFGLESFIESLANGEEPAFPATAPVLKNEQDAERMFVDVVRRVAESQKLVSPSVELQELLAVAQQYPNVIRKRLPLALKSHVRYHIPEGGGKHTWWTQKSNPNEVAAILTGAVAIRERIVDEDLFDEVVFYKQWRFIALYDRPETVALLTEYLRSESQRYSPIHGITFIREQLRTAMESNAPEVQAMVQSYLKGADAAEASLVKRFVERQLELGADKKKLADWVAMCPGVSSYEVGRLLMKIAPPDLTERMKHVSSEFSSGHSDEFRNAAEPLITYLIDAAQTLPKHESHNVLRMLVANHNNPRVREFMKQHVTDSADGARRIEQGIPQNAGAEFSWFADHLIEQVDRPETLHAHKRVMLSILARIGTDPAWDKIRDMAESNEKFEWFITTRERLEETQNLARLRDARLAKELIAGRITPEDLLETERYEWGEHGYELVDK